MAPPDWLLLLIAARPGEAIDPVRIQKGLFLLAMEGGLAEAERYRFEPYSFGPLSRRIYADVRELEGSGAIESLAVPGHGWRTLLVTSEGLARAVSLRASAEATQLEAVDRIRSLIDRHSFGELLEHVYARYPQYAVRSVFRRP